MMDATNNKKEGTPWRRQIIARTEPPIVSSGPTNSHENQSKVLATYPEFSIAAAPTATKNHETTASQSRPTPKRKIDMEDLAIAREPRRQLHNNAAMPSCGDRRRERQACAASSLFSLSSWRHRKPSLSASI